MGQKLTRHEEYLVSRGLAVQPLVTGILGFLLIVPPSELAVVFGVLFAITGALISVLVAYPILIWVVRRGQLTKTLSLVCGAMLGNIPAAIAVLSSAFTTTQITVDEFSRPVTVGTVVGILSAMTFWWVSGRYIDQHRRLHRT